MVEGVASSPPKTASYGASIKTEIKRDAGRAGRTVSHPDTLFTIIGLECPNIAWVLVYHYTHSGHLSSRANY